jgi:hypothetical protein
MSLLKLLFVATFVSAPVTTAAGDMKKLREIEAKDLKVEVEKGNVTKPQVITSEAELIKAIPNADAVKKQVDFSKEKLLLFAWTGASSNQIRGTVIEDGKRVHFTFIPGRLRDSQSHVHLFAVPKDAEFKVLLAPGGGK